MLGAAAALASQPALALAPGDVPVVAWAENSILSRPIYVRRWAGTAWAPLGGDSVPVPGAGTSAQLLLASWPVLAMRPDGGVYLAAMHGRPSEASRIVYVHYLAPGTSAWTRLFEELCSAVRVQIDGRDVPLASALSLQREADQCHDRGTPFVRPVMTTTTISLRTCETLADFAGRRQTLPKTTNSFDSLCGVR